MLARQPAQARPLGAQGQADLALELGLGQRPLRLGGKAGDPEAAFFEDVDGAGKVGNPDQRNVFQGAGGRLGQRTGFRCGVALGQDDSRPSRAGDAGQKTIERRLIEPGVGEIRRCDAAFAH